MKEAWIIDAVRTPVGRVGKSLATVRPDDLGAYVLKALLARTEINANDIEDVYMGCANQAGEDSRNIGRMAVLLAGLPEHVAGCTINRLCGSSLEAVAQAARAIQLGEAHVYIGAGVESMSRAPWAMPKAERAYLTGNLPVYNTSLGWRFINEKMRAMGHTESMGETAENLVELYKISRQDQDKFAWQSHQKALAAQRNNVFDDEIVPVSTKNGEVTSDEGPRADTTLEKLATLRAVFRQGGTVTAGNSSSLNDGAAAVLLVSKEYAQAHGLKPLARILTTAVAGVAPRIMGIGPAPAVKKALARTALSLKNVNCIELNEAFAAQSLAVLQELKLDMDDARLNQNGGAIALGHPLGCSGARIITTLVHQMKRDENSQFGLATMCIGVGQGIAMLVEKMAE